MAAELKGALKDSKFAVNIAVGAPKPKLIPQTRGTGLTKDGVYSSEATRYILKKAHLAMDDFRLFDIDGNLVVNSHHPGKNPLDALDPLGMANTDAAFNVAGGEWESQCDVSAHSGGITSFKVRPKTLTIHGRQLVKTLSDDVLLNVAKIGKISSRSIRPQFAVCRGGARKDRLYRVIFDLMGRTAAFYNDSDQLVAVMTKTRKALILNAVLGAGSESTIDIAPGVDCSVIIAAVFGLMQCGASVIGDAFNNFVRDPLEDAAVDHAMDQAFGGDDEGKAENEEQESGQEYEEYAQQETQSEEENEAALEEIELGDDEAPIVYEGDEEGGFGFFECIGSVLCAGGEEE